MSHISTQSSSHALNTHRTVRAISSPSLSKDITSTFVDAFQRQLLLKTLRRLPATIKTLANLCQLLDDYAVSTTKIEQIERAAIDSVLWSDDPSHPIAIDQNNSLNELREIVRGYIHECLELIQQILIIHHGSERNRLLNEIQSIMQKCTGYLSMLKDYRTQRQTAFTFLSHNHTLEDGIQALATIDRQQYHELRLVAIYLRQFFLKLITIVTPTIQAMQRETTTTIW